MNPVSTVQNLYHFFAGVLSSLSSSLPDPTWLKVVVIAVLTWGWEEPISLGTALMVASGDLGFWPAFAAMAIGFPTGDSLLYLIGRFGKPFVSRTRWYQHSQTMRLVEGWFRHESYGAVFAARFTPGFRLPTYIAAGIFHVRFRRFFPVVFVAGLLETTLLLMVAKVFGETVLDQCAEHKKLIGGCLFAAMLVFVVLSAVLRIRKLRREGMQESPPEQQDLQPADVWHASKFGRFIDTFWNWITKP